MREVFCKTKPNLRLAGEGGTLNPHISCPDMGI
jgi:hypothetical protein